LLSVSDSFGLGVYVGLPLAVVAPSNSTLMGRDEVLVLIENDKDYFTFVYSLAFGSTTYRRHSPLGKEMCQQGGEPTRR
jgi:hypothetical protein